MRGSGTSLLSSDDSVTVPLWASMDECLVDPSQGWIDHCFAFDELVLTGNSVSVDDVEMKSLGLLKWSLGNN